MKADSHKVRVKFDHGNAMSLDLKGCGSIYIEPNKEYFFENAPMQFINYLAQLRRLGITYRLTNDKKGCYMTIDLTGYQTNEPKTILGNLRSNLVSNPPKITRHKPVKDDNVDASTVPDLIPQGTFKEEIKEVTLFNSITETPTTVPTEVVSEETTDTTVEVNKEQVQEPEIKVTIEEVESMGKPKLLELAKSLGIAEVSEIWTKRELRKVITEKLSN